MNGLAQKGSYSGAAPNEKSTWGKLPADTPKYIVDSDGIPVMVLTPAEGAAVVLRFGLHWGSTVYVGQIATSGRTEVTALGDEVNETARIEACATGGRALASKVLVERLSRDDAADLELDPGRVTYTPLADLATATEKARRDAPAIAVCEV